MASPLARDRPLLVYKINSKSNQIKVADDQKVVDIRREIYRRHKLTGFWDLTLGGAVLSGSDLIKDYIDPTKPIELASARVPSGTGSLRLRCEKPDKFFHLTVYFNETIGDLKQLLEAQYLLPARDSRICPRGRASFDDDVILWNLDLTEVYQYIPGSQNHPLEPPKKKSW
jgi:hypothetical protein